MVILESRWNCTNPLITNLMFVGILPLSYMPTLVFHFLMQQGKQLEQLFKTCLIQALYFVFLCVAARLTFCIPTSESAVVDTKVVWGTIDLNHHQPLGIKNLESDWWASYDQKYLECRSVIWERVWCRQKIWCIIYPPSLQVISVVSPRKGSLSSNDILLLSNYVSSSDSFRQVLSSQLSTGWQSLRHSNDGNVFNF